MFSHVVLGTNDLHKAKAFYDAIFSVIQADSQGIDAQGRLFYVKDGQRLIIGHPIDGQPATHANGGTIGFQLTSEQDVYRWHEQGTAHGGTNAETPPHVRPDGRCVAYLRDPDNNKLCAAFQTR